MQPSPDPRTQLWYLMSDVERESRYYGKLADRTKTLSLLLSASVIILSLAAGVLLLYPNYPESSSALLFLAVSSLSVIMVVYDFSGRSRAARITSDLLRMLQTEARQAWYRGTESLTQEYVNGLERRMDAYRTADFILDKSLNEQSGKEANKVLDSEFKRETSPDADTGATRTSSS